MKRTIPAILFCLGLNSPGNAKSPTTAAMVSRETGSSRPNVIVILSDDQGYGDFSCHGNPVLKTPALDKLHNESIRFGNFHVAALCTPTRGQLMSGLDAMHNKAATVLAGRNLMRRDIVTMPEVFSNNGYATGIFGKWHLGDNYPDRPMDRGFQKCIWHKGWGLLSEIEYDNDYYETRYLDSLETKQSGEYCTNLWFNKSIEWMDEMAEKNQAFFTYLALNAPHGPFYSPAQDYNFYRYQVNDSATASFFGMIRNIDRNMARLDDWLEKTNLKKNTLVIFMTDNGGTGGVELYNAGMRDKKGSNYDGGHRAACFMRWPNGNFGDSRTVSSASQIQDLLPTFIDLFGLKLQNDYQFDGQSLKNVLFGEEANSNRMFVVQQGIPVKFGGCVVRGSWRLVGENELYNMDNDPSQQKSVATNYPEIYSSMRSFYEDWWKKIEPGINQFVPVVIGSPKENPVIFNSNNWVDGAVNTQWKVAQAGGDPKGGISHLHIAENGKYKIELSRWPFHLQRSLTSVGPKTSVGGAEIRSGKSVPIHFGCVSLNNSNPVLSESKVGATAISFEMEIRAGDNTFQAWFKNKEGKDICGAYYVKVERLF